MADGTDKHVEAPPEKGVERGASAAGAEDTRTFVSVEDAAKRDREKNDLGLQQEKASDQAKQGATKECWSCAGDGQQIAQSDAVKQYNKQFQSKDQSVDMSGESLNFASMKAGYSAGLGDIVGKGKNGRHGQDRAGNQTDKNNEVAPAGKDNIGKPGDNNVRDLDPSRDNPQAVQERYSKMVDGLNLPADQAAKMKDQFQKDMDKVQQKFQGDDLNHVMRSMNLMMDSNNQLQTDANRVNAVSGLAARGANPEEANRQGNHPTCALTSGSRIEQERNFVRYADQMGSVAAHGGAWRGGENGQPKVWVDANPSGTGGANFKADAESSHMYDKNYHQAAGHRDYLGQLDNALLGNEMAKYQGQRDGKDYAYVTANAARAGADVGQGSSNGAMMVRQADGTLRQSYDGNQPDTAPPSTLDNVARLNYANGGGGLMIQENLAREFRNSDGTYPPGMNVFKDANDLRAQLQQHPGQEYQIATNGVIVAGMAGHGLHAQTVKYNDKGQLEFGNNWTNKDNHRVYDDSFVNTFTNPGNWKNYHPQHTMPDGHSPDWRKERVGPGTENIVERRNAQEDKARDDEKKKKEQEDSDKDKEKAKQKEKQNEEEQRKKQDKDQQQKHADQQYSSQHAMWQQRKSEHDALVKAGKASGDFSEKEPERSQFV